MFFNCTCGITKIFMLIDINVLSSPYLFDGSTVNIFNITSKYASVKFHKVIGIFEIFCM